MYGFMSRMPRKPKVAAPRAMRRKPIRIPDIDFPPGRPTSSNIKLVCKLRKVRPRYVASCIPRGGYGWLARQSKSINRLERGLKRCCKEKENVLACADEKVITRTTKIPSPLLLLQKIIPPLCNACSWFRSILDSLYLQGKTLCSHNCKYEWRFSVSLKGSCLWEVNICQSLFAWKNCCQGNRACFGNYSEHDFCGKGRGVTPQLLQKNPVWVVTGACPNLPIICIRRLA